MNDHDKASPPVGTLEPAWPSDTEAAASLKGGIQASPREWRRRAISRVTFPSSTR
jgi:hypothetical protein